MKYTYIFLNYMKCTYKINELYIIYQYIYTHTHTHIYITFVPTSGIYTSFHGLNMSFGFPLCQPSSLMSDALRNKSLVNAKNDSRLMALNPGSGFSCLSILHEDLHRRLSLTLASIQRL